MTPVEKEAQGYWAWVVVVCVFILFCTVGWAPNCQGRGTLDDVILKGPPTTRPEK